MLKTLDPGSRAGGVAICAALVILTIVAFSGVTSNAFLNYDDDVYVTDNPHVLGGLTGANFAWALTSTDAANWHPVTWMSHMLDVQMFAKDAARHHLTSLVLHAANSVLLLFLLFRMTGAVWPPALVAALFAIHPLHVESVAWVAERKDVLSTLFWLLTLLAWLHWLARKTPARYALVLALFAVGLMAKPMLVTLPFTLMLFDYWPLKRASFPPLWKEKLPLFAMSLASCVVTVIAQKAGGALQSLSGIPFPARIANATVAYAWYLVKTVWPASLAVFYPYPVSLPAGRVAGAALLLCGLTALAFRLARRAPYVLFGWLWFLGTLVPVIGLVQVGAQATADRYTYVPLIGLFVAIAWGLAAAVEARPAARYAVAFSAAGVLVALLPVTRAQVRTFSDNVSLFKRALAVTANNGVAHNNLGLALMGQGKADEAVEHYREALRIKPGYVEAQNNLAVALRELGLNEESVEQLGRALALDPDSPSAHVNLGNALVARNEIDAAIEHYRHALRSRPAFFDAEQNLGLVLDRLGRHDEAIAHFRRALALRPDEPATHLGLGIALSANGAFDDAMAQLDEALRLKPDSPEAYNALAIALAGQGRTLEAIQRYEQALRLKPSYAEALNNLGLALATMKRLPEAIERFEQALRVNPDFAQAHNNLGVAYAQSDRLPQAIAEFEQAVRLDPGFEQARGNLRSVTEARH
jgi:tetratricopeptide (TPR) repeat protein